MNVYISPEGLIGPQGINEQSKPSGQREYVQELPDDYCANSSVSFNGQTENNGDAI